MKAQRFFIGQEVTPAYKPRRAKWVGSSQFIIPYNVPVFGKTYYILKYEPAKDGSDEWYVKINGFSHSINESYFAPLVDDSVLMKDIAEIESEELIPLYENEGG